MTPSSAQCQLANQLLVQLLHVAHGLTEIMEVSLRDALIHHGWKPEWLNETGTIARLGGRAGSLCFVPFSFRHRLFQWHRYIPVRNLLGAKNVNIKYSSALRHDWEFLATIDFNAPLEVLATQFPWDKYLSVEFFGYPMSMFNYNTHQFGVIDEEKNMMWKLRILSLTWIRDVTVRYSEDGQAT